MVQTYSFKVLVFLVGVALGAVSLYVLFSKEYSRGLYSLFASATAEEGFCRNPVASTIGSHDKTMYISCGGYLQ